MRAHILNLQRYKWLLPAILFCGLLLRIHDLGTESIWRDEGFSIRVVTLGFAEMMDMIYGDPHPPLYYLVLRQWTALFGTSEFAVRFPSVIFGILSIFMVYKVGKLLFHDSIGIFAALIVTFSAFQIQYSQEARNYSLVCLLSLTSYYYFIKLIKYNKKLYSIFYMLSSILLMYTHIYGTFTIISQSVYLFIIKFFDRRYARISLKHWALLQVSLGLLFLPWFLVLVKVALKMHNNSWIPRPSIYRVFGTFVEYSGSVYLFCFFILLFIFSFLILGTNEARGRRASWFGLMKKSISGLYLFDVRMIGLLFFWLSIPIILPVFISLISTPIYWIRYTIGSSFAFYLLIAVSVYKFRNNKFIISAITACFLILSCMDIWEYYSQTNKVPWRQVAHYIDKESGPRDMVVFSSPAILNNTFNYYSKRDDIIKYSLPTNQGKASIENITDLLSIGEEHKKIWLIMSHNNINDAMVKDAFSPAYRLTDNKTYFTVSHNIRRKYKEIELFLFEKNHSDNGH